MWGKNRNDKNTTVKSLKSENFRRVISSPVIIMVFALFLIAAGLFIQTHDSFAAPKATGGNPVVAGKSLTPSEAARSWLYYTMLSHCFDTYKLANGDNNDRIHEDNAKIGEWLTTNRLENTDGVSLFDGQDLSTNYYLDAIGRSGDISCGGEKSTWIMDAIELWGYKDGIDALCAFGAERANGDDDCRNGSGDLKGNTKVRQGNDDEYIRVDTFQAAVKKKVYGGQSPSLTDAQRYIFNLRTFKPTCLGNENPTPYTGSATDKLYKIKVVNNTGSESKLTKYYGTMLRKSTDITDITVYNVDSFSINHTCVEMEKIINDTAPAYQAYVKSLPNGDTYTPSDNVNTDTDDNNSCGSQVSGLGWIICPILSSLTKLNDGMWKLVSGLLTVDPITQNDSVYKAWGSIRSIANVLFVIFFLIIIFSQLTGAGITNYGVKKMLPKIIIAAILVNISFIIIQLSVDLVNIIGSSLYSFIVGMAPEYTVNWGSAMSLLEGGVAGLAGGIAVVAAADGPVALFFLLLGLALIAALGLLTAVLTLIFRQAAIIVLVLLAPLAFVAYLLPNTEPWFKKWRGLLMSMLLMYPMAALIFAGAQFAAATIIGDGKDFWNILIGLTMMALPLFSLPFIARQGGSILKGVNGALSGLAKRASPAISNWSKSHADAAAAEYRADNGRGGVLGRYSPSRGLSRAWGAGRLNREKRTEAAKSEFESQINNNQVRGISGRRIDGQATNVRAAAAKEALAIDSTDTSRRLIQQNPNVNARHGGTNLNERKYDSDKEKQIAEDRNTERLESDMSRDPLRHRSDAAKTDAKSATDRAATRIEPGLLQVRENASAAESGLTTAQNVTKRAIANNTALDNVRENLEASTVQAATATDDAATRTEQTASVRAAKTDAADAKNRLEAAQKGTETIIADNTTLDAGREQLEEATIMATSATDDAAARIEPDLLEARAEAQTSTEELENARDTNKQYIEEAAARSVEPIIDPTTGAVITPALSPEAMRINAATRARLKTAKLEKKIVTSATAAATNEQNQEIAEILAPPDGSTSAEARRAGGIGGDEAIRRVQASATSTQAGLEEDNIKNAITLFADQGYQTGSNPARPEGELMRVAIGGTLRDGTAATDDQIKAAMRMVVNTGSNNAQSTMFNQLAEIPVPRLPDGTADRNSPEFRQKLKLQQSYSSALKAGQRAKFFRGGILGRLDAGMIDTDNAAEVHIPNFTPSQDIALEWLAKGKFSGESFVESDNEALRIWQEVLSNPDALASLTQDQRQHISTQINDALNNPLVNKGELKEEQRGTLTYIQTLLPPPAPPVTGT